MIRGISRAGIDSSLTSIGMIGARAGSLSVNKGATSRYFIGVKKGFALGVSSIVFRISKFSGVVGGLIFFTGSVRMYLFAKFL